uniref:Uncharacterized protein n=1 Tax=Kalanchoe fedtschenkoi TaxID=63787 RepID=A0A7N0TDA0_KALFE
MVMTHSNLIIHCELFTGIRRSSRFGNTSIGDFRNTEDDPVNVDDDDEIVVPQARDTKKSKATKVKSKKPKIDVRAKGKEVLEETSDSSDESDDDIDGTDFCMQSDEDTRPVKVQLDKKICMFKSRCTPYRLYHSLSQISEKHKEAIRNLGFGKILDLNMFEIPSRFGEWLVDAFDPQSCTLRTQSGAFKIRTHDIHQITGIPVGGQRILMERRVDYSREIVRSWRMRYGITNSAISATKIMDKMIKSSRPDKWFLLDCLVLFTTTMRILNIVDRPEDAIKFDWSRYVVDSICFIWGPFAIRKTLKNKNVLPYGTRINNE